MQKEKLALRLIAFAGTFIVLWQLFQAQNNSGSIAWLLAGVLLVAVGFVGSKYLDGRVMKHSDRENEVLKIEEIKNAKK